MKKKIWLVILSVFVIGCLGGVILFNIYTSPKYSLNKINVSISNHDISSFEKYVDIDGVITRLLTELPGILNIKKEANFLGEEAVYIISGLVKESVSKLAKESVRRFIERGHFDKSLTKEDSTISKLLKEVPISNFEVIKLGNIVKEGKICKVPLEVYIDEYEGNLTLVLMMRDKGMYWQVAEISSLSDSIIELIQLKKDYPYKNLCAAALFITNSFPSKDFDRVEKERPRT